MKKNVREQKAINQKVSTTKSSENDEQDYWRRFKDVKISLMSQKSRNFVQVNHVFSSQIKRNQDLNLRRQNLNIHRVFLSFFRHDTIRRHFRHRIFEEHLILEDHKDRNNFDDKKSLFEQDLKKERRFQSHHQAFFASHIVDHEINIQRQFVIWILFSVVSWINHNVASQTQQIDLLHSSDVQTHYSF
jgi:hypothetical protein